MTNALVAKGQKNLHPRAQQKYVSILVLFLAFLQVEGGLFVFSVG